MDVKLNAWGVASIVGTLIGRGVTDGYAKLPSMVEQWKSIAAGAFESEGDLADEPMWSWDASSTQELVERDPDAVSVRSEEEFYDADNERLMHEDDLGSGLTTISTEVSTDTDDIISAENLLISSQPNMGGMDMNGRVKMGTEQPEEQATSTWALCGLGSFFY